MSRLATIAAFIGIGLLAANAGAGQSTVAELIAELKKTDGDKLKAIEALEALGEKAGDAAPALVELLHGKNEDVRLHAAMAMAKIGQPAVEPLSKALSSTDAAVRFYAVWGLAFVGPKAKSATPVIVKAMADPAADVRRKAAYALGRIDADPEEVVGVLVQALGDPDADVRQTAASALPKMSKAAVPALIKVVRTGKGELRDQAIRSLGEMGSAAASAIADLQSHLIQSATSAAPLAADTLASIGAPAIPTLVAAASHDDAQVRALAMRSLQKIGAPSVPSFVDLLGAKHVDVKRQAAALLGAMQVQDKSVVIALGFATRDKDYLTRANALQSLRQMGTGAKLAEPYIAALLTDIDPNIRLNAFNALREIGVDPQPGLRKALRNPDPATRINTASLMAILNLEVQLAEPILLEGLKEKNEAIKMQAAHALSVRGLQENVVLPIFIAGLKNETVSVRKQAAESIARYRDKGKAAAPALIEALDDSDDTVRAQALATLRAVGGNPKELLPAMAKVLRSKHEAMHAAAAQVVFQAGPDAIPEVVALLKKEDGAGLRLVCMQMLSMVGPPAKDALELIVQSLSDPAPRTRMIAVRALGNIGPDAKGALDALAKLDKDEDANVRSAAKAAIVQIKGDPNQKGFEVQGVLTAGDPIDRIRTSSYHVVHTHQMKKGQTYTILLNSQWDNFLRLENSRGDQVAADDDGGGFPNARIIYACPADGWYRIIVTSYTPHAAGAYALRVR